MQNSALSVFFAHLFRLTRHVLARLLKAGSRNILRQIAVLCAGLIAFSATGSAETKLVIATSELAPYVSENPKESFLTELFEEIGKEMGVTFEFRFMPWKRCELAVESGEVWSAIPYVPTPERQAKYYFSDELFYRHSKFFYYSPSRQLRDISYEQLSDLKPYRIGAVRGYYYEKAFLDAGLNVEFVDSEERNLQKLRDGKVDLIPAAELLERHLIQQLFPQDAGNFFAIPKPFNVSPNYLMASKQYPDTQTLLKRFNLALQKIKETGVFRKLKDKHSISEPD